MDSNKANTGTFYLTIVIAVLTAFMVGLMMWVRLFPDPAQAPTVEGRSIVSGYGWGPPIVLSGCLLLAVILQVVAKYMMGRKQVAELTKANEKLGKDLSTANSAFGEYETKASELEDELAKVKRGAKEAEKRANDEKNQKDGLYRLFQDSQRQLAELAWLRQMAEEQAKNMPEHLKVTALTELGSLMLSKAPRCVVVALCIRNESVFDITICPKEITGHFFFRKRALHEPARQLIDVDHPPVESLRPMQRAILMLEQPLIQSEAETIIEARDDESEKIWLGNVTIPISIAPDFPEASGHTLRINSEGEYVSLKDVGKKTNASALEQKQALTREELLQKIEALPPTDRASAYKNAQKLYGANLEGLE